MLRTSVSGHFPSNAPTNSAKARKPTAIFISDFVLSSLIEWFWKEYVFSRKKSVAMERKNPPHRRTNALFTESGRPPRLQTGSEATNCLRPWRKSFSIQHFRLAEKFRRRFKLPFPILSPFRASQNNSHGFTETSKLNFSVFCYRHRCAKVCLTRRDDHGSLPFPNPDLK
jgi:hypothetical protein